MKTKLILIICVCCFKPLLAQKTVFVNQTATGLNNGSSWANAYTNLQTAFSNAANGDQVWLAKGVYKPTSGSDRDAKFSISKQLKIYGGFAGNETSISNRTNSNETILSGEIGANGMADNSFTIISIARTSTTCLFDKITFEKAAPDRDKSAIIADSLRSFVVNSCVLRDFTAAGTFDIVQAYKIDSLVVTNSNFSNSNVQSGSSIFNESYGHTKLYKNTFTDILCSNHSGALYITSPMSSTDSIAANKTNVTIEDCQFTRCQTLIYQSIGQLSIKNCFVTGSDEYSIYFAPGQKSNICHIEGLTITDHIKGPAIYTYCDQLLVENSVFEKLPYNNSREYIYINANKAIYRNTRISDLGYVAMNYYGKVLKMENVTIENIADTRGNVMAVYTSATDSLIMDKCTFKNIKSTSSAQLFMMYAKIIEIGNSSFIDNATAQYNQLLGFEQSSIEKARLFNNVFSGNSTIGNSLIRSSENLILENNQFIGNKYQPFNIAWGTVLTSFGKLTSSGNRYIGNIASTNTGTGAVYNSGDAIFQNDIFMDNQGDSCGAIINVGTMRAINCSFVNNSAVAVLNADYFSTDKQVMGISNCLFYDNKKGSVASVGEGILKLENSFSDIALPIGTNNIVDSKIPFGLELRPLKGSLLINNGRTVLDTINLPLKDIDGNTRIMYGKVDIGAYEYAGDTVSGNKISGKIFRSLNNNCQQDLPAENPISGFLLEANPGQYYTTSDASGNYEVTLQKGNHTLKSIPDPNFAKYNLSKVACPNPNELASVKLSKDTTGVNFAHTIVNCPLLTVSVNSSARRRCFANQTVINYANEGTGDEQNVTIKLVLPRYVTMVSSIPTWKTKQDSVYTYLIPTLKAGEKGAIQIVDSVRCVDGILGITQCTKASISPKNSCLTSAGWNGSDVTLEGKCKGTNAEFTLSNNTTPTADGELQLFVNGVNALAQNYSLRKGDNISVTIPANGNTIRLEASQSVSNPTGTVNYTVEGCGNNASLGFVNQLPVENSNEAQANSCLEIRGSFDPNDKSVSPTGVTKSHFIRPTDPLQYTIRFQNTGNDTAFTVVIVDTLSQNLDITTFNPGAASHPFTWKITGKVKPVLTFTFNNILLPDSTSNKLGSNGFVSFKILQKANNPNGTVIRNESSIFFDYNSAIVTNEVFNTVMNPLPSDPSLGSGVVIKTIVTEIDNEFNANANYSISPNPFKEHSILKMKNMGNSEKNIQLTDLNGVVMFSDTFTGNQYELKRGSLKSGLYFYKIESSGQVILQNKVLVID